MSREPNKQDQQWLPCCSNNMLQVRARLLADIRAFFAQRKILEVETPLLSHSTIPDPNIASFVTYYQNIGAAHEQALYLQTSPEFAMKRLLAAGSGSIYQICKAFRNGEQGKLHNPEFSILEWYRVDFNHHQLMDEMDDLLHTILNCNKSERITYTELFIQHLGINPLLATAEELNHCAQQNKLNMKEKLDKDEWMNLLLTHIIEPNLGKNRPTFIYDFPASQAALAKIDGDTAQRFEVYIDGIELANGFNELVNAKEQRQRFQNDIAERAKNNLPAIPIDENFLVALKHGFPACAGVAVGIDRLLMLLTKNNAISNTLAFSYANA